MDVSEEEKKIKSESDSGSEDSEYEADCEITDSEE